MKTLCEVKGDRQKDECRRFHLYKTTRAGRSIESESQGLGGRGKWDIGFLLKGKEFPFGVMNILWH